MTSQDEISTKRMRVGDKLPLFVLSFFAGLLSTIASIPPTLGFALEPTRHNQWLCKATSSGIIKNCRPNPPKQWAASYSPRSSLSAATSSWQEEIQLAIQDSKLGQSNIEAAHRACDRWKSLLDPLANQSQRILPDAVQTLCFAMYASCLVRTGQDDKAIGIYEQALCLLTDHKDPACHDLLRGKAKAHQRLLQYSDALEAYSELIDLATVNSKIPSDISDVFGAATCSLRLQQPKRAHDILMTAYNLFEQKLPLETESEKSERIRRDITQLNIFLAVLLHCMGAEKISKEIRNSAIDQRTLPPVFSSKYEHPLYVWLHESTRLHSTQLEPSTQVSGQSKDVKSTKSSNDAFLALMKINQSPWDDPFLLQLDDKVLLHRLLSMGKYDTSKFWPKGYVVPTDKEHLINIKGEHNIPVTSDQKWIAKARAGYGSHGNQIMTLQEAMKKADTATVQNDEFLLQELIDPTLLIDGRKFSLRLYVIYFTPEDFYLSNQGLVKLAAIEAAQDVSSQSDDSARRAFMTNSGREQYMEQHDLTFLQHESNLFDSEPAYASFWYRIEESIKQVMKSYRDYRFQVEECAEPESFETRRQELGIPKILGLDYLIDTDFRPWLLEVNRFPGLEPRDDSDRSVKHQVVRDAWLCAQKRLVNAGTNSPHPLQYLLDHLPYVSEECPYSLERLH